MANEDVLPSSLPRDFLVGEKMINGIPHVKMYCANCKKFDGTWMPKAAAEDLRFCFYLCNPCGEKWAPLAGTFAIPDEVFGQKLAGAQLEKYGRYLQPEEMAEELKNGDSVISKLARERFDWLAK